MRNGLPRAVAVSRERPGHAIEWSSGNGGIASREGRPVYPRFASGFEAARRRGRRAGSSTSVRKPARGRAPRAAFAGVALFGLFALAGMQPAMAAQHSTGHFLVSVRVVYHCQIKAEFSTRAQNVVMILRHCPGQPRLQPSALSSSSVTTLPGAYSTRYTFTPSTNSSIAGVTYVNVTF